MNIKILILILKYKRKWYYNHEVLFLKNYLNQ